MHWSRRHDRGRPPHPDVLTPAEWRVLEHVRGGLPNAEIAVRLGISVNTVRVHVSNMLAKLELRDRQELAVWDGQPAQASRSALARFRLAAPAGWVRDVLGVSWVTKTAGAGAVAALSLAGIVALSSALQNATGADEVPPAPTTIVPSPVPTPVDEGEGTPESPTFETAIMAAPIDVDGDFVVVTIIPNTDAPPVSIDRITLEGGAIRERETLLEASDLAYPQAYLNNWRNIGHPQRAASDALVVSVCHQAQCGGLDWADEQARTTLMRSRDQGATWEELATLDGAYWVLSWSREADEVLLQRFPTEEPGDGDGRFLLWPSMGEVQPPAVSPGAPSDAPWPFMLGDGRVAWWWSDGRLLDEAGAEVLDLHALHPEAVGAGNPLLSADGERMALVWRFREQSYWSLLSRRDDGTYEPTHTLAFPDDLIAYLGTPYGWFDSGAVMISGDAAVLDFTSGELRPINGLQAPAPDRPGMPLPLRVLVE